jgi:hypothetical protein
MDDMISRQAAIDAFDCTDELIVGGEANAQNVVNYINKVVGKIETLPSAQPQPVVRCKDCKYWMRENVSDGYCSEMNIGDCDEDFYCGYAVRKDNR